MLGTRVSTPSSTGTGVEAGPPLELDLAAGERRLLKLSGVSTRDTALSGFMRRALVFVPRTNTASGSRIRKEVREIGAQGLMSTSRLMVLQRSGS